MVISKRSDPDSTDIALCQYRTFPGNHLWVTNDFQERWITPFHSIEVHPRMGHFLAFAPDSVAPVDYSHNLGDNQLLNGFDGGHWKQIPQYIKHLHFTFRGSRICLGQRT
jgi:hypothetical protein